MYLIKSHGWKKKWKKKEEGGKVERKKRRKEGRRRDKRKEGRQERKKFNVPHVSFKKNCHCYFLKEKIRLPFKLCNGINIRSFLLTINASLLLRKEKKIIQEQDCSRKLGSGKQKCPSIPWGYGYKVVLQSTFPKELLWGEFSSIIPFSTY